MKARGRTQYGGVLLSTLAFVVVLSLLMVSVAAMVSSQYARTTVRASYAGSMDMAEAGVNYELNKISINTSNADQITTLTPGGVTYSFGNGGYTVYCANKDGSTPWNPPGDLYVVSVGTVNGTSRTVKAMATGHKSVPDYALFGVSNSTVNGGAVTINGSVGTDGKLLFNGGPTVNGNVVFNGAGSGWLSPPNGGNSYSVIDNSTAQAWPTVESKAAAAFPSGGLAWLASHNDNSLAVPAISSNKISINGNGSVTLKGKSGGANYYLTSILCNGNAKVTFDNSAGPINIWFGPSGGSGTFTFNGGTASVKMSQDPTKPVTINVAASSTLTFNGNNELDALVYDINNAGAGNAVLNGNPTINGSLITHTFTLNGHPTINYQAGLIQGTTIDYYGYVDSWTEINPL